MDSYLERLHRELEKTMTAATPERMDGGPAGKWTAAQVLEQLFLTYHHTNKGLDKCLEKGMPLGTRATLRHRFGTLLVVHLAYFPPGRKSPERAAPKGMAADEVRLAILPEIRHMDAGFAECTQIWCECQNSRPPVSRIIECWRVAQVPLGAWTASRTADSGASRKDYGLRPDAVGVTRQSRNRESGPASSYLGPF